MKFFYYLVLFSFLGCKPNPNNEIKMIDSFITEVILNNNYTTNDLLKFINLNKHSEENKKEFMFIIIDENIKFLKEKIQYDNMNYEVLSDKEVKKQKIETNFLFDDYTKVYHLLINKKVITSFVFEDGKILSFSYNLIKNKNQSRTPLLL